MTLKKCSARDHSVSHDVKIGKIYRAFDKKLNKEVALKIEKEDKHKKILKLEYEILKSLQGNISPFLI